VKVNWFILWNNEHESLRSADDVKS